jgi:hypothetical protein
MPVYPPTSSSNHGSADSYLNYTDYSYGSGASTAGGGSTNTSTSGAVVDLSGSGSTTTTDNSSGPPPLSQTVSGVGYSTMTFTVRTRSVLKIRFTPGMQNSSVAGGNFAPQYARLAVFIKVGSLEQPTALLSNGLATTQETSSTMDFSSAFTKTCASTDTACRQTVTITVSKPNYDYWCYNYGLYCDHTQVYQSHLGTAQFTFKPMIRRGSKRS